MDPVFFISICLGLGLFSGFIGGLLGIGGGVIIVPTLYLIYDATNRFDDSSILIVAIATSLSCVVFTSASAAFAQNRRHMVLWGLVIKLLPWLLFGSLLASYVVPFLPALILKTGIACFLISVAAIMISSWQPPAGRVFPGHFGGGLIGTSAGFISGSAGIAGGNVIVPTLIFFNTPRHSSTATSSFLGVPIALSGSLGYLFFAPQVTHSELIGYVDITAFIPIIAGSILAAPIGVKIAHNISPSLLKKIFGGMLLLASTKMLIDVFSY